MSDHTSYFPATDAYQLLAAELAAFRQLSYGELLVFIGPPQLRRIRAPDSTEYALQITVRWRSGEPGDILVEGWIAVDDCGPMRRLDDYFIVPRDESRAASNSD